ncbi:MAG: nitroreductase family protein, partial [Bacteroidales bacterium]
MDTSKILNLILAVALVVLSVKVTFTETEKTGENIPIDTSAVILDNIMTRTSVRSYTDEKIEDKKVELIL